MTDLQKTITEFCNQRLRKHPKLVLGVSGGVDSVVLLDCLVKAGQKPIIAHLDHRLRSTSAQDANFVQQLAERHHLQYFLESVNIRHLSQTAGLSIEAAGRQARYKFFAEVAEVVESNAIMTAHHANDQAESILLHLIRGSGLNGLVGMTVESTYPPLPDQATSHLKIFRPFLSEKKATILEYAQENQIDFREDESNQFTQYNRNYVRKEILPRMGEINPNIVARLGTMGMMIGDEVGFLEKEAERALNAVLVERGEGWVRLQTSGFQSINKAIQRRILRGLSLELSDFGVETGLPALEFARFSVGKGVGIRRQLNKTCWFVNEYDCFVIHHVDAEIGHDYPQLNDSLPIGLEIPSETDLGNGWQLKVEEVDFWSFDSDPNIEFCQIVANQSLVLRPRRSGERFTPFGGAGSKSVKAFMIDQKVPQSVRERWPIVATREHIVWVVGLGLADEAQIKDGGRTLKLSLEKMGAKKTCREGRSLRFWFQTKGLGGLGV